MVANLPTNTVSSILRDIKVHNNHAFIVSEASRHGMQVVDLTQLSAIANPPQDIEADALYMGWGNAHNIVINESTARAYGVGTATFAGGLHILDISDPVNPTLIGDYAGDGYTHDAQQPTGLPALRRWKLRKALLWRASVILTWLCEDVEQEVGFLLGVEL